MELIYTLILILFTISFLNLICWIDCKLITIFGSCNHLLENNYCVFSLPIFGIVKNKFNILKNSSPILGLKKGFTVEVLPLSITTPYNSSPNKVFRITGGFFTFLVISKLHLYLDFFYIKYIILYISFLFLLQLIIILILRIVFAFYNLLFNKKLFEVRDSHLNSLASPNTKNKIKKI